MTATLIDGKAIAARMVEEVRADAAALAERGWAPRLVHGEAWRQVSDLKPKELLDRRYERLMSYGRFNDTKAER